MPSAHDLPTQVTPQAPARSSSRLASRSRPQVGTSSGGHQRRQLQIIPSPDTDSPPCAFGPREQRS